MNPGSKPFFLGNGSNFSSSSDNDWATFQSFIPQTTFNPLPELNYNRSQNFFTSQQSVGFGSQNVPTLQQKPIESQNVPILQQKPIVSQNVPTSQQKPIVSQNVPTLQQKPIGSQNVPTLQQKPIVSQNVPTLQQKPIVSQTSQQKSHNELIVTPNITNKKVKVRTIEDIYNDFCSSVDDMGDCLYSPKSYTADEILVRENKAIVFMEEYKLHTGDYPLDRGLAYSSRLLTKYLDHNGIKPEIFEYLPEMIREGLSEPKMFRIFPWRSLYLALKRANRSFDMQLFLVNIVEGGAEILADFTQFGIKDDRLEHAITTIQRLIRYGRKQPPPADAVQHKQWIQKFEEIHHHREADWDSKYLHLRSFNIAPPSTCFDGNIETCIVHWNRHLIPEYIYEMTNLATEKNSWLYDFSEGIDSIISTYQGSYMAQELNDSEYAECSIMGLLTQKKEELYSRQIHYLLDDDALTKIPFLLRFFSEGTLMSWKNPRRDALKFLSFTINDKSAVSQISFNKDNKSKNKVSVNIAECYLERMNQMPLSMLNIVFKQLDDCLAHKGRQLINTFVNTDLNKLSDDAIRYCFNSMAIDNVDDIAKTLGMDKRILKYFLRHNSGNITVYRQRMISFLQDIKNKLMKGEPLYEYKIWTEPITVSAVTIASPKMNK